MDPYASATALVAALHRRQVGSRELLASYLDRIDRLGPATNAVVTLDVERAQAAAAAADEAAARGADLGPLHGLPVTVKDTLETAGLRTTSGAPELADHVPARDALVVARLRAAGAVVFGKTNTSMWAADAQTFNPIFGTTTNPWDRTRSPGGSSGGPAAAVAAGLTGADLGADLGGSIRTPAHYCGVYGLRPSYGVVPQTGHIPPPPGVSGDTPMGTIGPIARAADDLGLLLDAIAGPGEADGVGWRLDLPAPDAGSLTGYRVGLWLDDEDATLDSAVGDVLAAAADALREAGVPVREVTGPLGVAAAARLFQELIQPVMAAGLPQPVFDGLAALAATDDRSPRARWARDVTARARDWAGARSRQAALRAAWREVFADVDVVLCPVAPTTAIPHDQNPDEDARRITINGVPTTYWAQVRWTQAFSPTHLPAASVPVGLARDGLPVGMQVVGRYLEDRTVIDVASRMAPVVGGFLPPPRG